MKVMCRKSKKIISPIASPGSKSTFNESIKTTSADAKNDSITKDTVLIFYAPWCGHCKRSMGEFLEAVTQGNGKVMMFNSDDPGSKDLITKYNINGFPTIMKASGEKYTGPRTSSEIIKFSK